MSIVKELVYEVHKNGHIIYMTKFNLLLLILYCIDSLVVNKISTNGYIKLYSNIDNDNNIIKPLRRLRYNGKYPKQFTEKYKEINNNSTTIQKVLEKGITPAGRHISIILDECINYLNISNNTNTINKQVIIDCTLGYGGHSLRILRETKLNCQLIAFDKDIDELNKTTNRINTLINRKLNIDTDTNNNIFIPIYDSFSNIANRLNNLQLTGKVDAVLADLGLSSMQIDNPNRGFTYKTNAPLDMRMDQNQPIKAIDIIIKNNIESLTKILFENSDETHALEIASAIYSINEYDELDLPTTSFELINKIRIGVRASHNKLRLPPPTKYDYDKAIARTIQAIRIEVNNEFTDLDRLLNSLPLILKPGGRVVILTFHSGEDRRVKQAFKDGYINGIYSDWSKDLIKPSFDEIRMNPRSRSAKLRWAIKS